jgi:hypothetical protein
VPLDLRRKRDLGRILDDAFALYGARWGTFALIGLAVALPVDLIVVGGGLGWLWSDYRGDIPQGDLAVVGAAQLTIMGPLATAMAIDVVQAEATGAATRARRAIQRGLEAFAALLAPMAVVTAAVAVGALFVVPGLVALVFWSVVPQAVVVEGARGGGALRRSAAVVSGRGWWVAGVLTVGLLVTGVAAGAVVLGGEALAETTDAQAVTLAALIVAHAVTLPLMALIVTLMYFALCSTDDLDGGEAAAGEPADEDGREPDAWERRVGEGWRPPA